MPWVKMTVREWVPDDSGNMIALELTDVHGLLWTFVERPSVVAFETINASTTLPKDVWVECLPGDGPWDDSTKRTISLAKPHAITAQQFGGVTDFVVRDTDYLGMEPGAEQIRDEIIQEIYSAFRGVTRQGGRSWSMCEAEDMYWSSEEAWEAGLRDIDTSWEQLVDDKRWSPDPGVGGFAFIDDIGFRYYIPVVMIRSLRDGDADAYIFTRMFRVCPNWSPDQLRATARFFQFMATNDIRGWRSVDDLEAFRDALSTTWSQYLDTSG